MDWTGLLKWSTSFADSTTTDPSVTEMTEEKRQFLSAVMESMVRDEIKEMKALLDVLSKEEVPVDEKEAALEDLHDRVDNIDVANDLFKIGGFRVFKHYLHVPEPSLRWRALDLVAVLTQNNEFAQRHVLQEEVMQRIVDLISDEDPMVRTKAVYASSGLVRHYKPAELEFLKCNGFPALVKCVATDTGKARLKALFLLPYIVEASDACREQATALGLVRTIAPWCVAVDGVSREVRELSQRLMVALVSGCPVNHAEANSLGMLQDLATLQKSLLEELKSTPEDDRDGIEQELLDWSQLQKLLASPPTQRKAGGAAVPAAVPAAGAGAAGGAAGGPNLLLAGPR